MGLLRYSELNDVNAPRPVVNGRVFKELEAVNKEFNVQLRFVWGPDRLRTEMIGLNGNILGFVGRVYCQNPRTVDRQHIGWWVTRSAYSDTEIRVPDLAAVIRHEGPFALPRHFPQTALQFHYDNPKDQWWVPHWKEEEVAYNRFFLEQKLSNKEKDDYEGFTFNHDTLELVQELGKFPDEGLWAAVGPMIAEHNPLCCREATEAGALCPGKYREPSHADVEAIKAAIQARNEDGLWVGVDDDNRRLVTEIMRQRTEAATKQQEWIKSHYKEVAAHRLGPIWNQMTPKVIGGVNAPLHTRPFDPKQFDPENFFK